jgi:hypothetical protein
VAREVLNHVYAAERLQLLTWFGAVLGTYDTLWARARLIGYWREVVRSGDYARLGVYALEVYGISRWRLSLFRLLWGCWESDYLCCGGFFFGRLVKLWGVGRSWGITWSRARPRARTLSYLGRRCRAWNNPTRPYVDSLPPRVCLVKFNNRFDLHAVYSGSVKEVVRAYMVAVPSQCQRAIPRIILQYRIALDCS